MWATECVVHDNINKINKWILYFVYSHKFIRCISSNGIRLEGITLNMGRNHATDMKK